MLLRQAGKFPVENFYQFITFFRSGKKKCDIRKFATDESARNLESVRWPDGPVCDRSTNNAGRQLLFELPVTLLPARGDEPSARAIPRSGGMLDYGCR